jgi:deoxyribodipyrimidine photolyase
MSPYLHFGQISPLDIALQVLKIGGTGSQAFLEQLIVRRELAVNFVHYNHRYDSFDCLPAWAKTALRFHQKDKTPVPVFPRSARTGPDPRPLLERRPARDGQDGEDALCLARSATT